jgi:hypothetical protein
MIRNASSACTVTARLAGMAVAFAVAVGLLGAPLPARSQGSGIPTLPGLSKLGKFRTARHCGFRGRHSHFVVEP